ncbi:AraC-like DNA-binding protein [Sphingomonas sp. BE138]|uniref:helix-turn-helix domain-containing protein n=1 Tax=Sphingomonas sp. BE138 TaxID=2817845 RepID=UPI0028543B28|nr:helix-turn-helix domain-containing protein [Sphingomonas sp. BE138]MDR6789427.1 AraC-like DNA-binding protein [Sphingomonas sp. BE138]
METIRYGSDAPDAPDNFDEYFTFTNLFRFSRIAPPPFHAQGSFWTLGDFVVTAHRMGAVHAHRGPEQLATAPADHLTMMTLFDGTLVHEAEDRTVAHAGDVVLVDYARRFDYRTDGHAGATVSMPRALVESRRGPILRHGLLPATAETRLFAGFLQHLVAHLPDLAPESAVPVAVVVHRLMLAALGPDHALPAPGTARARAQAYLDAQPPGALDVVRMTAALGLSRSKLYRLFDGEGGVRAFDRRRRLRLLHMALIEEPRDTPLGVLGARFGFLDLSGLARQFRGQFGYSMSELRDHLSPVGRAAAVQPLDDFRRAFERLSQRTK